MGGRSVRFSNGHHIQVKLEDEEHRFPDFRLCVDGSEVQFELTSVDRRGRRRGFEHRQRAADPLLLTPYRPAEGDQEGPGWIAEAVHRKAQKRYAAKPHLLVYANFDANDLDLRRCLNLCQEVCDRFLSVWILWAMHISKIYDECSFAETEFQLSRSRLLNDPRIRRAPTSFLVEPCCLSLRTRICATLKLWST